MSINISKWLEERSNFIETLSGQKDPNVCEMTLQDGQWLKAQMETELVKYEHQ